MEISEKTFQSNLNNRNADAKNVALDGRCYFSEMKKFFFSVTLDILYPPKPCNYYKYIEYYISIYSFILF